MDAHAGTGTLRAAVVQAGAIPFDTEACVDKAVRLIGEAAATGAKLIVFPEAFIPGYPKGLNYGLVVGARDPVGREEFRLYLDAAIAVPGPQTQHLGEAAAAHRSYVVIGVIERDGATCHCTALFFGPDGALLGKHRKLMPTVMERVIEGRTLLRAHRRRPRHLAAFDATHRARGTLFRSHCMPVPAQAGFSADGARIAG